MYLKSKVKINENIFLSNFDIKIIRQYYLIICSISSIKCNFLDFKKLNITNQIFHLLLFINFKILITLFDYSTKATNKSIFIIYQYFKFLIFLKFFILIHFLILL